MVFHDNQKFQISFDNEKDFKKIFTFALEMLNCTITAMYVDNEVGLVLLSSVKESLPIGYELKGKKIKFVPDCYIGNLNYLLMAVYLEITSTSYCYTFNPTDEECELFEDFDGSECDGWVLGTWEEANQYLAESDYDYRKKMFIRHYRTGYGK